MLEAYFSLSVLVQYNSSNIYHYSSRFFLPLLGIVVEGTHNIKFERVTPDILFSQ